MLYNPPLIKRIISVNPAVSPVLFTISGRFLDLAANHPFRLILLADSLQSNNTNPVSLTDTINTFTLTQGSTGNVVRYDQFVKAVDYRRGRSRIEFECFFGDDGVPSNIVHVVINTRLPRTTFIPTPTPVV